MNELTTMREEIEARRIRRHGKMPWLCEHWTVNGICTGCGRASISRADAALEMTPIGEPVAYDGSLRLISEGRK